MSSLPPVQVIRSCIESCKEEKYRMFLKAVYLLGAARAAEICGAPCGSVRTRFVYGPKGTDVSLDYTDPPDMRNTEFAQILMKIVTALAMQQNLKLAVEEINKTIDGLNAKIPVAIFRIKIAKQKLEPGEEPPYRLVALPLPEKFEPWAKQLYDYFKKAGKDYVFDPIFKGLTYRIKKYALLNTGEIAIKVLPHIRDLKIHGLRHIRTDELMKKYLFDGYDFASYVGWSLGTSQKVSASPVQSGNYSELREGWERYIKKLCVHNSFNHIDALIQPILLTP
jgi:hypothetical protein